MWEKLDRTKPTITLKAYEQVKSTLQAFLDRKNKRKKNTAIEPAIYGIVVDLVSRIGNEISTSQVWNAITCDDSPIPGFYDSKKPNEYQTQDYGTIYRDATAKLIYDNFGAEPKHRRQGNSFVFDVKKLAKAGKVYDSEAYIQAKLIGEGSEPCEACESNYSSTRSNTDTNTIETEEKNGNTSTEKATIEETFQMGNCATGPTLTPGASLLLFHIQLWRIR